MIKNKHYQSLLNIVNKLTYSHDTWEIFYDFVEMSAIAISNAVDYKHFDKREELYLNTIKKYKPEYQELFSKMFAELTLALEYEYQTSGFNNILGSLFHEFELHNKYKSQFFTPQHICDFMGKIALGDKEQSSKIIQEQGFIKVSEPACGSGAMVLGFAQAMKECGYNHSEQMFVSAVDIDLKCVYMCYIQLSLYGIPAVIAHGNSLSLEEWSRWYTPVYIVGGWGWRSCKHVHQRGKPMENEIQPEVILPTTQEAINSYEQLDLFK